MKKSNFLLLIAFGIIVSLSVAGMIYVRFFGIAPVETVKGNNDPGIETRVVRDFRILKVRDDVRVIIEQGDFEVRLEGESNLLPHLLTEIQQDALVISRKQGVRLKPNTPLQVVVRLPSLEILEIRDAASVSSAGTLHGKHLRLELTGAPRAELLLDLDALSCKGTGAPEITLSGRGGILDLNMTGAGNFHGEELACTSAAVTGTGAVGIEVHVTQKLEVNLTGASNLRFRGKPDDVRSRLTGASTMDSME
jgi:hypothetical protein